VYVEEALNIGSQQREVRGPFEIQAGPIRECAARERAFSALPWPYK
jgi:hypothetical protein